MENFALNQQLLFWLYPDNPLTHGQLLFGSFLANYLILLFPIVLIYQCLRHRERRALVIVIFIALLLALGASALIQHFCPTNRPFADGLVSNLIFHKPNNAFPSDHTVFASTVAFGFILARVYRLGFILLAIAIIIGLSRVSLGIHYPLDIAGGLVLGFMSALICIKGLLNSFQKALL